MAKRKTFFSFHFKNDVWRAGQVRNMGIVEGNTPVSDNDWEEVKKKGDKAIEDWIEEQLNNKTCTIVLIGEKTASRKWVKYEIKRAWERGKGILGINIHNLKDSSGNQSTKGDNPFDNFTVDGKKLSNIVKVYNPPYATSTNVYDHIKENIDSWVEEAIKIRNDY